jgi:hypothetical protein
METVDKFYKTLSREEFEKVPPAVQRLFYSMAVKCNCEHNVCEMVRRYYNHLLLDAGIFGRKELVAEINISAAQKIPEIVKAKLKTRCIQGLMQKFDVNAESVYFYDDSFHITKDAAKLGINAINVKNVHLQFAHLLYLIKEKKRDPESVSLVLIDFDKTFSISRFKKKYHRYSTKDIVERHFAGAHRVHLLFEGLKKLESLGVKVGFITFHTKNVLDTMLLRLGWIVPDDGGDGDVVQ